MLRAAASIRYMLSGMLLTGSVVTLTFGDIWKRVFFFLLRTLFSYMPNQAVMNLSLSYSGIYWRLFLVSSSYRYIEKNPYICYTSNLSPPCSCRVLAVLNMHCFTVYTLLLWQPKVCWKYGPNKRRNNRFALAVFICLDGSFPISCLSCFAQVREPKSE